MSLCYFWFGFDLDLVLVILKFYSILDRGPEGPILIAVGPKEKAKG